MAFTLSVRNTFYEVDCRTACKLRRSNSAPPSPQSSQSPQSMCDSMSGSDFSASTCSSPIKVVPMFPSTLSLGSSEAMVEDNSALVQPAVHDLLCHFGWRLDPKKFDSTSSQVTKKCDSFIATMRASAASRGRGQSSFRASDGKGKLEVKPANQNLGECTVIVTVGDESDEANHYFSPDSTTCKLLKEFDFKEAAEKACRVVVSVQSTS